MLSSSVVHSRTFSNSFFLKFACGFLLTTGKKTVPAIAKNMDITTSKVYRIIKNQTSHSLPSSKDLFKYIQSFSHEGYIVIDDTSIIKEFSKQIQGTSEIFDTVSNRTCIGLSLVTIAWTDGTKTIPLEFGFWYNKDVAQEMYQTKIQIAQSLIQSFPLEIKHKGIIFDGLYATQSMMSLLTAKAIRFVARMAANRVVTYKGIKAALKNHPALQLRRNEHSRTIYAEWCGQMLYFTKEKRKDKNGQVSCVFLVSNFSASSNDYVIIYKRRWAIEAFYRSSKQSLGLKDCQSTHIAMQKAHIYNVFYLYTFLHYQKELFKLQNIESALRSLLELKKEYITTSLHAFNQIFYQYG